MRQRFCQRTFWLPKKPPAVPYAPPRLTTSVFHDKFTRKDEFAWLKESPNECGSPANTYLKMEMKFAERQLEPLRSIQQRILHELRDLVPLDVSSSAPTRSRRHGEFEYFERHDLETLLFLRRPLCKEAKQELIFSSDWLNDTENSGGFIQEIIESPLYDHFAFIQLNSWQEQGSLKIWKIPQNGRSQEILSIPRVFRFLWSPTGSALYFTRLNEQLRCSKVLCQNIQDLEKAPTVVYEEPREDCFLDISLTKDNKYVIVNSSTDSSSEVRILESDFGSARLIKSRQAGVEYYIDHVENGLVMLDNDTTDSHFKLSKARDLTALIKGEMDLISEISPHDILENMELFKDFVVFFLKVHGLSQIRIQDLRTREQSTVELPEPICRIEKSTESKYEENILYFSYSSDKTKLATCEFNMQRRTLRHTAKSIVTAPWISDTHVRRLHASGSGGTQIPVTLYYRGNISSDSSRPLLVLAYGVYGTSLEPEFRPEILPLLKRGYMIALAHVRGGGELGPSWTVQGRCRNKENSVTDLHDVIQHLVKVEKYVDGNQVAVMGESAGGLLVGSLLNRYPGLVQLAIFRVPFLDPLTSMLERADALSASEVSEWGDPLLDPKDFNALSSYAPYDNVHPDLLKSTSVLITAGLHDVRVPIWHSLKYAARVRSSSSPKAQTRLVVQVYESKGHLTDHEESLLEERSLEIAFILNSMKL